MIAWNPYLRVQLSNCLTGSELSSGLGREPHGNWELNRTFILRTTIFSDLCHGCDRAVEQNFCRHHSQSSCDVQELENEEGKGKGKARLNFVVEFDRAEFPAPNISSQS